MSRGPIEVHLTENGGPSWIEILGPAAIVAAAIVGALAAYLFASRNVSKELKAADERLGRQLRHDRAMRMSEATRATLDESTNALTAAMDALTDFAAAVKISEDAVKAADDAPEESEEKAELLERSNQLMEKLTVQLEATADAFWPLHPARLRLRLRFLDEHPVYKSYSAVCAATEQSFATERVYRFQARTAEELEEVTRNRRLASKRLNEFVEAVREWMASVVDAEQA